MNDNQKRPTATDAAVDWTIVEGNEPEGHRLRALFYPRAVAVVGASPRGGYGLSIISALKLAGFSGGIYPVNPNHQEIAGLPAYPEIGAIPEQVDAVAIAVPSRAVPVVVEQAIKAGVKGGVAFGSGFAEAGEDGQALQAQLRALCGDSFPLIGPNCLGVTSYLGQAALWAIPIAGGREPGAVGLVAQSGNMALTLMASSRGLQLAHVVSTGNQAVVDAVDVMSFYVHEPGVRVIAAVIEGLADIEKFRRVATQAAARDIPIVALKLGRSEKASRAAIAHTGSLTGADDLYDALFRQYGVLRVNDLEELTETAKLLADERRPAGGRLGVFASSGGECGLISDLADVAGVQLPELPPETRDDLLAILPPFANPFNPLDITAAGWGSRQVNARVATHLAAQPEVDIVAYIGDVTRASGSLSETGWEPMIAGMADARASTEKPIAIINTITDVAYELTDELAAQKIIQLTGAGNAVRAIGHAGRYARWRGQRRSVSRAVVVDSARRAAALELLGPAGSGGLSESVSKALLRQYDIPVPARGLATNVEDALALAAEIGYPIVLKIEADGLHHKTEVGGVALGIGDPNQLRSEFAALLTRVAEGAPGAQVHGLRVERMESGLVEFIIGGKQDPAFGPVVVAGLGGVMAEALQDVSTRLAPVELGEAQAMLAGLRGATLLGPFRGRPAVDADAVAAIIVRVSQLLVELPEILELDLNPVLAGPVGDGCIAVDGLVVV